MAIAIAVLIPGILSRKENLERVPSNLVVLVFNPEERMFSLRLPGDRDIVSSSDTTRRKEVRLTDRERRTLEQWRGPTKEGLERYETYLKRELKLPLYRVRYLDTFFQRLGGLRPEALKRRLMILWFSNDEHHIALREVYLRLHVPGQYGPRWTVEQEVFNIIERLRALRCELTNVWLSFEYF